MPPMHAPIVGFAGMWVQTDEAHVTIIGVAPAHRGRGVGEYIFTALIDEAMRRNATWITLEVRVSNQRAQSLYAKYGFSVQGTRRRYYSDDGEDAYVMSSPPANTAAYREQYARAPRSPPMPGSPSSTTPSRARRTRAPTRTGWRMDILAIESSCDETAAAVISGGRHVRSNIIASQNDLHARLRRRRAGTRLAPPCHGNRARRARRARCGGLHLR